MNNEILNSIWAVDNSCWWTSYQYMRRMSEEERSVARLVEGEADGGYHCWVELNGEIIDPHYAIIGEDVTNYQAQNYYTYREVRNSLGESYRQYGINSRGEQSMRPIRTLNLPHRT